MNRKGSADYLPLFRLSARNRRARKRRIRLRLPDGRNETEDADGFCQGFPFKPGLLDIEHRRDPRHPPAHRYHLLRLPEKRTVNEKRQTEADCKQKQQTETDCERKQQTETDCKRKQQTETDINENRPAGSARKRQPAGLFLPMNANMPELPGIENLSIKLKNDVGPAH